MSKKFAWKEDNTTELTTLAGSGEITQEMLVTIADTLGTTARSVGAKLRNMGHTVQKAATKASAWSEAQEAALTALLASNPGAYTYAEIAASFENGAFDKRQVQGKILSMELFTQVRKADKPVVVRSYTEAEETKFVGLANGGASMEALAEAFDRPIAKVRGKALSLLKSKQISAMPKQEKSSAKERVDLFADLDVANMSVEQLVEKTGKTERGIRSTLSRRGITCSDYDGAARRAKLDEKTAE